MFLRRDHARADGSDTDGGRGRLGRRASNYAAMAREGFPGTAWGRKQAREMTGFLDWLIVVTSREPGRVGRTAFSSLLRDLLLALPKALQDHGWRLRALASAPLLVASCIVRFALTPREPAASNRAMPGAVTALFLYDRYSGFREVVETAPAGERLNRLLATESLLSIPAIRCGGGPAGREICRRPGIRNALMPRRFSPAASSGPAGDYSPTMSGPSKDAVSWVTVDEAGAGQRVDNFLARHLKGVPKSHLYRILRSGEVRINKARAKPETRLVPGDTIRIPPIRTAASAPLAASVPDSSAARTLARQAAQMLEPRVLFEDDALLAVDKPAGLAVHGGSGIARGLIEQLRIARPEAAFLELVHRLDRETSGVLLVAKKRAALVQLHAALREGRVDKRYFVLVRGRWRDERRVVRLPLHKYSTHEGERRVRVDEEGRNAVTTFRRQRAWPRLEPPLALLEAELHTGRTHQIRVHLTHLGFPLAADDKYGDFAWNRDLAKRGLKRMFLHAARIAFDHPLTRKPLEIASPLPADLAGFIAALDASASPHVEEREGR